MNVKNKLKPFRGTGLQCDQMARLFVQNLAIYSNKKLAEKQNKIPKKVQNFGKFLFHPKTFAKEILKSLPKLQNFAKSGHTEREAVSEEAILETHIYCFTNRGNRSLH